MFSIIDDAWNKDPVKEITKKYSDDNPNNSIILNSDDLLTDAMNMIPRSPASKKEDQCQYFYKHFKKCKACNNKIQHLIDKTIDDKLTNALLKNKLDNAGTNSTKVNPNIMSNVSMKYWKDILIIVLVFAIFFLMVLLIIKK